MNTKTGRKGWISLAVLALITGAIAVAVIAGIVMAGDGDDADAQAPDTPAAPTPTAPADEPDTALGALSEYVHFTLGESFLDECQESYDGDVPDGVCSLLIDEGDGIVKFALGHPLSEGIGLATVTQGPDGSWTVAYEPGTGAGSP